MPRPITKTLTTSASASASTSWIPMDIYVEGYNVGVAVENTITGSAGSNAITLLGTFQNVFQSPTVSAKATITIASDTGGFNTTITTPFTAIKLRVDSAGSASSTSTTLRISQAGVGC